MDNEFISSLKEKADIVTIIGQYVELKRSGNNYKACCPFHKEKTPSFMVNEQRQSYKCFGCGKGGDVYTFIQDIENVEFYEAVHILADRLGIEVPKGKNFNPQENSILKTIKEINLTAGRHYYKTLLKNQSALSYLRDRGVSAEMIKSFGLGYADNSSMLLTELRKNFSEEELIQSGIASKREGNLHLIFRERIIFPIFNTRGEIIAFGGRQLGEYGPKYLNSPETKIYSKKDNLYALQIARKNIQNKTIFLVEGYMDVISMHQNGYKNTVASLGTALTMEQAQIISKLANNVFILYDSDNAGVQATLKALDILGEAGVDARVITLQDAKDPDEFFKKNTSAMFQMRIDESLDYLRFNIVQIEKRYDISGSFGKDSFVKEAVQFIKEYLQKPFARQIYVEDCIYYLSDRTSYSVKSIGVDIFGQFFSTKQFQKNREEKFVSKLEFEIEEEIDKKEMTILNGLLIGKVSFDDIKIEDFVHSKNRKMYHQIQHKLDVDIQPDYSQILTSKEYAMLIRSVRNTKLDLRIEHLEKVQEQILFSQKNEDISLALLIGNYIIKLKNKKNEK